MRHDADRRIDQHLDIARCEVSQRGRRTLVGHMFHLDTRDLLQELAGQVCRSTDAGGSERDLAGVGFGIGDQFAGILDRQVVGDRQDQRRDADQRHRREARLGVETELPGIQRLVCRVSRDDGQERVAVGCRLGDGLGTDQRIGPGLVVDHEWLPEIDLLQRQPSRHVGETAGRVRHDPTDWLGGPRLRPGGQWQERDGSCRRHQVAAVQTGHAFTPCCPASRDRGRSCRHSCAPSWPARSESCRRRAGREWAWLPAPCATPRQRRTGRYLPGRPGR